MATRKRQASKKGASRPTTMIGTPPELIVVTSAGAGLRATPMGVASVTGKSVSSLGSLLKSAGASMAPVFGGEDRVMHTMSLAAPETREGAPDLTSFYRVQADEDQLEKIADRLRNENLVDAAYVKPPMFPPVLLEETAPAATEAPPASPDFTSHQGYLDAAPGGIDARYAWTRPGGDGQGVRIIDIEGAWRFSHEDLIQNQGGVIGGVQSGNLGWRNHGTAVVGEFGGDATSFGVTGICPAANVRAISIFGSGQSSSKAIVDAANALSPGDIILIELHAPGPRHNFQDIGGQLGFIAVEFWPADFAAILYATSVRGVIVVEAAGNGAEDLDDPLYDVRPTGFPTSWRNPFNLANPQSGAIVVGAGAPPPGTHGRNHGPDRSRLDFSNYGSRVDVQGWGREVTTCGYGDLQGGTDEDLWYTDEFSGTSSASPIVVGAIGCAQGARIAAGQARLTPATALNLVRTAGSPQQSGPNGPASQRIGNRPDLRQMIPQPQAATVPLYRYWNPGIGDHFYTTNWSELGAGNYGWIYEGVHCYVVPQQRPGAVPLYRYWNPGIGDHFYTTNWSELGAGNYGWGYEGVQAYVYPSQIAGTVPLYRYWNAHNGDHFYTTNWAELGYGRYGWGFEGIQCYVFPQPAIPPAPPAAGAAEQAPPADQPVPEAGSMSGVPATFTMGMPADPSSSGEAPEGSFVTAKRAGEPAAAARPSSFTTTGAAPTPGKSGQVTVNINVNAGDDEVPS